MSGMRVTLAGSKTSPAVQTDLANHGFRRWRCVFPGVLAVWFLALAQSVLADSALSVARLRCESLRDPVGIDVVRPRLSWNVLAREGTRAERQTAYRVLVASSREVLARDEGDLWDSGRVESGQCIHVVYGGRALASRSAVSWKVKVWDAAGAASAWSPVARFSMGLLEAGDWRGAWIGIPEPKVEEEAPPWAMAGAQWIWFPEGQPEQSAPVATRYFRRVFVLSADATVVRAELLLAADNEFAAAVNGVHAGSGSSFRAATLMNVAGSLRPGTNVVAAWVKNAGASPNPAGLMGFLRVELEGGRVLTFGTDARWRALDREVDRWTALELDDGDWREARVLGPVGMGPWGAVSGGRDEDRRLAARMLRREFEVSRPVRRATVYFSGLGLSELHLDGEKLGDHVLSPGLTEYTRRVQYLTFDVTSRLGVGRHALGAWLGNGRYHAPRGEVPTKTLTYGHPKMLLQLEIDYADGSREWVVSDERWKVTAEGPITANNEYDGEEYDARREMPGWARAGFDDQAWAAATVVPAPGGKLVAPMMEPIRVVERLRPMRIHEPVPGMHIFDMGQNMVGWCRLRVRGPAGTQVKLRHAETLRPDGTLYLDNIRGARVTDVYTLRGGGTETYEPRFTYHGFRYVEVTGYPGTPGLDAIEGCVVHDDVEPAGEWSCANEVLNRILAAVRWGVRGNYRGIPTDCPQRDERQGWLGDRSAECRGESYLFDIEALYSKWVQDMEDAQREDGAVPDVCPPYWPIYSDNVTWPSSTVMIPGMLRDQYGDIRTLARHYQSMRRWVDHIAGYVTNDVIARDSYGDWCVPPEDPRLIHSEDPLRKTHPEILATGYLIHDLGWMSDFARALGKADDASRFDALSARLTAGLNRRHFKEAEGWYDNGSQTSCVVPLAFGLVPAGEESRVFGRLVHKLVHETRGHVGTGLIGGQWLMRTLTDHGRLDLAWQVATNTTYPSWGYMLDRGATTIWELWNGDTADPAMNSGNHVMLVGDLVIWMYEQLAGIAPDPEQPAFRRIVLKPRIPGDLGWVKASHRSPHGDIASHWRREGDRLRWDVVIPVNATARVYVPSRAGTDLLESGGPVREAKGVRVVGSEGGHVLLEVESGQYQFESVIGGN